MDFFPSFFIASNGLFDFDLTFFLEAGLFLILSFALTFLFISPISTQINSRSEFISYNLTKSALFLLFGNKDMQNLIFLACNESNEIQRQIRLLQSAATLAFEKEAIITQSNNFDILAKFRKNFVLKSVLLFSNFAKNISSLTEEFFLRTFNSF